MRKHFFNFSNRKMEISGSKFCSYYRVTNYNSETQNIFQLETRSGTRAQFADMVSRCNAVGVRIFVDAIINHMLGEDALTGTGTGGSSYDSG